MENWVWVYFLLTLVVGLIFAHIVGKQDAEEKKEEEERRKK